MSIGYVSDEVVQGNGVVVDDVAVSTGEGSTSFEDHGDVLEGWAASGAPTGSPVNENDLIVGTVADLPPPGEIVRGSFARETDIIDFLSSGAAGTRSLRPVALSTICREWDSTWRTRPADLIAGLFHRSDFR